MVQKNVLRWHIIPKGRNPAHIGASVIHPDGSVGKVVSGQSSVSFGGKAAACVGDKVECPGHTGVIVEGAKSISIGGKSLAREGDKTSCGGVIMNGFPTITVNDLTKTVHGKSETDNIRAIQFRVTQSAHSDQSIYQGMPYILSVDGVEMARGVTDEEGIVHFELSQETKECRLDFANGQSYLLALIEEYQPETTLDAISHQGFSVYDRSAEDIEQAKSYEKLIRDKE